ncbi:polysaccharide lyase family 7 protein [Psychromonas sp.]|nr:polysaccharide lyase family 7 protein [Psychromonas sp.]
MNLNHLKLSTIALALLSTVGCSTVDVPAAKAVAPMKTVTGVQVEPAKYPQFAEILKASKLQISVPNAKPGSKEEMAEDGNFSGIVTENFYVDQGSEALVFKMEGYKLRNELRVLENFKTNDPHTFHRLTAKLLLVDPYGSIKNSPAKNNEMTVLQVHNKGTADDGKHGVGYIPHPLLRVVWLGDRNGVKNHYWAVIKTNALDCSKKTGTPDNPECKDSYTKIDLGAASATVPTKFDIIVGGEKLVINVDGETKVDHSLSYWTHMLSYFKAGVYNQFKDGQSNGHFYQLEYVTETK